jgi:hypothetical protein
MSEPAAPGGGPSLTILTPGEKYEFRLLDGHGFIATFVRPEPEQGGTGRPPILVVSRGDVEGYVNLSALALVWQTPPEV